MRRAMVCWNVYMFSRNHTEKKSQRFSSLRFSKKSIIRKQLLILGEFNHVPSLMRRLVWLVVINVPKKSLQLFHGGGLYHIETSALIYIANQWTSFYMIGTSVMRDKGFAIRLFVPSRKTH